MLQKTWSLIHPGATGKDRRRNPRKPLEDTALLMILTGETDVLQRASVQDISLGGVCFNNVEPVRGFARDTERINLEQTVMVSFENHPLILFGTLKRIDGEQGRVALHVNRSTDRNLWESLCIPQR